MAIAHIVSTIASGSSGGTSASVDTTGATLLVVVISMNNATVATPSDSKGNTWTALTAWTASTSSDGRSYYVANPTVGTGHTFTISGASTFSAAVFSAFSGAATTSPFDQEAGVGGGAIVQGAGPGSLTPSEANCLVVSGVSHATSVATGASGMTIIGNQALVGGTSFGVASAYVVQTTAVAVNPGWTGMGGGNWTGACWQQVFKAAAVGGDTVGDRIIRPRPLRNVGHPAYLS